MKEKERPGPKSTATSPLTSEPSPTPPSAATSKLYGRTRLLKLLGVINFGTMLIFLSDVFSSLVKVFQRVDGDKPFMGFLYGDLDNAKENIARNLNHEEKKVIPI